MIHTYLLGEADGKVKVRAVCRVHAAAASPS